MVALVRRGAAILLMACVLLAAGAARAQETSAPASDTWGDKSKPQNYVRSKAPKKEGESAYNWIQMGYAGVVMVGMLGFVVWLVRRSTREQT